MTLQTMEALNADLDAAILELVRRFGEAELSYLDTGATRSDTPIGNVQARIESAMRVLDLNPVDIRGRYEDLLKKNSK